MADENNARYRATDPSTRSPEPAAANDPLAELARLIGQTDPFGGNPRDNQAPISRDTSFRAPPGSPASDLAARLASATGYQYGARTTPQFGADAQLNDSAASQDNADPAPQDIPEPAPRDTSDSTEAHYGDDPRADWPGSPSDPLAPLPPMPPPAPKLSAPDDFDIRAYPDPRVRMEQAGFYTRRSSIDPSAYSLESELQGLARQAVYPQEPDSGPMPSPHADEFYDDARPANRRRGLLTVAAVLALAVVGTAAAFGYRSLVSGAGSSAPPPVIKASGEPTKVAPPPAQPDPSAGKFSYDRFGDRGKDEQVVAREEKPVDAKDLARSVVPRTVLSGAPTANTAPTNVGPNAVAPSAPSALGEPRRVPTVRIKPDQVEPAITPQTVASAPMAAAPPTNIAPPPSTPPDSRPAANPRTQPPRVAARPAPSPAAPGANAPLSLAPDGAAPPAAASAAAPPRAIAPTRPVPVASGSGGFVVQVSSRRSESEAEAAYRSLQSKYTSVLNGQPHSVKRADLGAKGVFFRAMVGPYGTRDQAIQVCSNLKAAGGECVVVQAN
jgi:hypothetical protein